MDQIESLRRELQARRRTWNQISAATGIAPKTLRKIYIGHKRAPHQTTVATLAAYFDTHPVAEHQAA